MRNPYSAQNCEPPPALWLLKHLVLMIRAQRGRTPFASLHRLSRGCPDREGTVE